jgi:hypothetical protein
MDDDPRRSRPLRLTPVRIEGPTPPRPVTGDPGVQRVPGQLHRIHITLPAPLAARTRRVEGTS